MTTALDLITRSMKLAGSLGTGETPTDDEASDGLDRLNSMLASLSTERLASAYYIVEETITLTTARSYTMGPSGDVVTTRPTRVEDQNFIRWGGSTGYDLQIQMIDSAAYAAQAAKFTESNLPSYVFVDMTYPNITLYFWPVPTGGGGVAHIFSWKQLQQFSTLTTDLALPQGYEEMIAFNLAVRWAGPEFGLVVPEDVRKLAVRTLASVKRINSQPPVMRSEAGLMTRQWPAGSIVWGQP